MLRLRRLAAAVRPVAARRTRTSRTGRSRRACCQVGVAGDATGAGRRPTCRTRTVATTGRWSAQSGCSSRAAVWWGSVYGSVTRSRAMRAQRLAGLERLLHHPAAARGERGAHRGVEAGRPEQRERRSTCGWPRGGRRSGPAPRTGGSGARWPWSMPFGRAGGARAEDDSAVVVGAVPAMRPRRPRRRSRRRPGPAGRSHEGVAEHGDVPQGRQVGPQRLEVVAEAAGQQAGLGEDDRRPRPGRACGPARAGGRRSTSAPPRRRPAPRRTAPPPPRAGCP